MKISTRTRYGTRAMLEVALHREETPIQLKIIAERQQISLSYLEQIVASLVRVGLLRSARGPAGGVLLARPPEKIGVSEIVRALEGSMAVVDCVDDPDVCSRADTCVTCGLWTEIKEAIESVFEAVTLKDLVERQNEKVRPDLKGS